MLQQQLAKAWNLPSLAPAGENLSFRTWRSPFRVPGMAEFVAALRDAGAVELAAPETAWGMFTRVLLEAALAAAGVAVRPGAAPLTLDAEGLRFAGLAIAAEQSLPLLVLHLAQALCFTESELFNRTLVAYDLEATGLGPADEITEIGAVKIRNGVVLDTFQSLVNPGRGIPPKIVELTSITNAMVKDAPLPREAVVKFLEFFGGNDTIAVVHNGGFDLRSIKTRARHYAQREFTPRVFDTRSFCQSLRPLAGAALNELAQDFGVELKNAHRALADAQATGEVFLKAYTMHNVRYRRFRGDYLRVFALALAAWPGREGEEERTLLNHLLTHRREYSWWRAVQDVSPVNFDRHRVALAAAGARLLADAPVAEPLAAAGTAAVAAGELALRAVTAQFAHELEGYAPFLRHNPRPGFSFAGVEVETRGGTRFLTDGRTRVRLATDADGAAGRFTPVLQPHRWFGWLWPTVVLA